MDGFYYLILLKKPQSSEKNCCFSLNLKRFNEKIKIKRITLYYNIRCFCQFV